MKKNFKNKILVALVCLSAIGSAGVQMSNTVGADELTSRVWIGSVRDYRNMLVRGGVTVSDTTYYKEIRVPHGFDELPVTYGVSSAGAAGVLHHWQYHYRIY